MANPNVTQSAHINAKIDTVWRLVSALNFRFLPTVEGVKCDDKADAHAVGSERTIIFKDRTTQRIRLTEFSDLRRKLTYELVESNPPATYSSVVHTISLIRVSTNDSTYIEFASDYSRDASNLVLVDSKYKKLDFFNQLRRVATRRDKNWLPLESNPKLMNDYITTLGVKGNYEFTDIYGVDPDMLAMVPQPVIAVMLLFPISEASEKHKKEIEAKMLSSRGLLSPKVYHMKQTVGNACGTVGLIHAVLNNADVLKLDETKFWAKFLKQTKNMNADQRAAALEANTEIEVKHKEVAESKEAKSKASHPINDNLHFNCWVNVDGGLYELDGRAKTPIYHGPTSSSTFLADTINQIKQFMARDPKNMLFSMAALVEKQ
jgi:ubiquitin carboxyl-terminal hydrolase L3